MNKMNYRHGFVLRLGMLLVMAAQLAACGGQSDTEKAAAEQQARIKKIVKKVQPADPLAGMSSAVTGSKGTLPVDVRFELLDPPELNKPGMIRLAFVPTVDLYAMNAVIKPMPGLQVADDAQVKIESPKTGEIKEYKFAVTPIATGIQLANVDVTVTRDTGDTTFTFSLPVPVPEAASAATASTAAAVK